MDATLPDGSRLVQSFQNLGNGRYNLSLPTDGWMFGYANLSIHIEHTYYNDYTFNMTVLVRPILSIVSDPEFSASHGENSTLRFRVEDVFGHGVYDANVSVTLGTITKTATSVGLTGSYEVTFTNLELNLFMMGHYTITINASHTLAVTSAVKTATLTIHSTLSLNITVDPVNVTQGDNFDVNVSVYDRAGHYIGNATVTVIVNELELNGYLVTYSTVNWERGNYTVTVRAEHPLSTTTTIDYSYVHVFALPKLTFSYEELEPGINRLYFETTDVYGNVIDDGEVIMEFLGINVSLNQSGVFSVTFNFTKYTNKTSFNATFYLVNASFVTDTKFPASYTISVQTDGVITVYIKDATNGSVKIYQGGDVNFTVYVTDVFGNVIDNATVKLYISDLELTLTPMGGGYWSDVFSTSLWQYGVYEYKVEVYYQSFPNGLLAKTGKFVLLPIISTGEGDIDIVAYDNASTFLKVYFVDKYGFPILEANMTINYTETKLVKLNITGYGYAEVLLN